MYTYGSADYIFIEIQPVSTNIKCTPHIYLMKYLPEFVEIWHYGTGIFNLSQFASQHVGEQFQNGSSIIKF